MASFERNKIWILKRQKIIMLLTFDFLSKMLVYMVIMELQGMLED